MFHGFEVGYYPELHWEDCIEGGIHNRLLKIPSLVIGLLRRPCSQSWGSGNNKSGSGEL